MKITVNGDAEQLMVSVTRGNDTYGVDVAKPFEEKALDHALDVLLCSLAGITKAEIHMAVAEHFGVGGSNGEQA